MDIQARGWRRRSRRMRGFYGMAKIGRDAVAPAGAGAAGMRAMAV